MQDQRDITTICLDCFATLEKSGVCPVCGSKDGEHTNPPPALAKRELLNNRYLLASVLGMGGFGVTYLAYDMAESKKVAVKEFFPKGYAVREAGETRVGIATPEAISSFNHWLKAFVEEARILLRIKSLHGVVKLEDFFQANNTAYIVTDYLEGESLRSYLTVRGHKIAWTEALNVLRPIAESLHISHESGVIHKDVSPENIQIVQNKYVKLIDFGAAALYKRTSEEKPFMVLKAGYSPIELYKPLTYAQGPWTDVYQIGATLFNCVTGYIPAGATERMEHDLLPKPSALGIAMPEYVENAIMKALALRPEDRQQTMLELMQELRIV